MRNSVIRETRNFDLKGNKVNLLFTFKSNKNADRNNSVWALNGKVKQTL